MGLETIVVTGRHHTGVAPFRTELSLATPSICCNGTYVWDWEAGRPSEVDPLERDEAERLLALFRAHGVGFMVYTTEAMLFEEETPHLDTLIAWAETQPADRRPMFVRCRSFEEVIGSGATILKFLVTGGESAAIARWHDAVVATGAYGVEQSWTDRWDVVHAGNSKGRRLLAWAGRRGIRPEEIIAFGDNLNDLDMIAAVGLGVAMGNGEDELKRAAAHVTTANDADGIAVALDRFLFA
jgi:Cof subfamily protein (haloacid dehalogenase superfamily)